MDFDKNKEREATLDVIHNLDNLYADQGKLAEVEKMYKWALWGYEEALGLENTGTCTSVFNIILNRGRLYVEQGDLTKVWEIYSRMLLGFQTVDQMLNIKISKLRSNPLVCY